MPKAYDFKLQGIFHTLSEFDQYRLNKPHYASDSSHVKNTCETLKEVFGYFEIQLNPEFFVLDASKAIASTIKMNFTNAKLLMCYY